MGLIYVRLDDIQEAEVQELMKVEGYRHRSEFIRFVIKFYKYHRMRDLAPNTIKDEFKRGEKTGILKLLQGGGWDV